MQYALWEASITSLSADRAKSCTVPKKLYTTYTVYERFWSLFMELVEFYPNPMALLYYTEHVHIAQTRTQTWIPTTYFCA